MTFEPEFDISERSPAVWQEVRRLEAEVTRLREGGARELAALEQRYLKAVAETTRLRVVAEAAMAFLDNDSSNNWDALETALDNLERNRE